MSTAVEVVAQGTVREVMKQKRSITGAYLSGRQSIPVPDRRMHDAGWFGVRGAAEHNLKDIDVELPVGKFIARHRRVRVGQERRWSTR